jgi:Transposase, Mutator family
LDGLGSLFLHRSTFGRLALIQRCQVHKGRNIIERLDPSLHAGVKKVLRQAWDSPTAEQAERVLKNLARRLDHDAPGVSASILEGLNEMLTVIRLGLPDQLRRALGCTNAIESLIAVLRQVCRNVKRWRDVRMALRWTGTAMLEAKKTFRRLKAYKHSRSSEPPCCAISKRCSPIRPLLAKAWQRKFYFSMPASPNSTGTGTIPLRLIMNVYLSASWIGRSPGFAPLRMRST